VSEVVRLTLVSHGMTEAMSAGRFPTDEPLNALGIRQVESCSDLGAVDHALCGPEQRTRQTADLLGLAPRTESDLADLDHGRWRGDHLGRVDPAELALWLTDAGAAPHGGETIVELVVRVRRWMDAVSAIRGRVVAVTHPAVIRAAVLITLDAPPKSFWRLDVAPLSRTVLHLRGHAWTQRVT
jgi:broad specificity phosphatase PhoE